MWEVNDGQGTAREGTRDAKSRAINAHHRRHERRREGLSIRVGHQMEK